MEGTKSLLADALKREEVIPIVIPENFTPSVFFSVAWPNGKEVLSGNELVRDDTLEEPVVKIIAGDTSLKSEVLYTLVMADPDAPSRAEPKYGQFRHWVITGLKLSANSVIKTNPSTTPYRPPGPPPRSGLHRYTFLLFEEPAYFVIPEGVPEYGAALEERRNWNAADFGRNYGLKLVGANFFVMRGAD